MNDFPLLNSLLNTEDDLQRENEKLKRIVSKLMARVERSTNDRSPGYIHFERVIALEEQIRLRTQHLQETLDLLNTTNSQLAAANRETEQVRFNLSDAIESIQEGFAIFNADEKLVMQNSRFCSALPDIQDQLPQGTDFKSYVSITAQSRYMNIPNRMSLEEWIEHRLEVHHKDTANFTLALKNGCWIQVSEQKMTGGGTIVLQSDITDHVRRGHEEQHKLLDQQAGIVKATLAHIEQGILIFDPKLRLVEWNENAVKILKIPRRLVDRGIHVSRLQELFSPDYIFDASCQPMKIFQWLNEGYNREILRQQIFIRYGARYEVYGQEMSDGSAVISFNDITSLCKAYHELHQINETLEQRVSARTEELRAARDAAEVANASKSRFVAAASHDLLQPVNAAKLFISSLQNSPLDDRQVNLVERIFKSFHSVETILKALLDISKLDSGQAALNISEFGVQPVLDGIRNEFSLQARDKNLRFDIIPCSLQVRSDPVYLRRILQNLVSNAIRYTHEGRILIGVRRRKYYAEFQVFDTGVGIAAEEQDKIFEEFHRINKQLISDSAMGLGLTIVKRACDMLGHELSLYSAPGEGSTFTVKVPYAQETVKPETEQQTGADVLPSLDNTIIMVVENDQTVAEGMEHMLESWGATPVIATSREQVFPQIEELDILPDIFLVDYHLNNGEDGLSMIVEIGKKFGAIRSILLTADRNPAIVQQAGKQGVFVRYKPLDIHELHHLVASIVAPSRE
ncbi:MAG: PAS-domain containing protein [Thiolinea sp.]